MSNTVKCPCNAPHFSVSGLVWTPFLKQSGYREKWSVTLVFYRVKQCSISPYFTYLYAVINDTLCCNSKLEYKKFITQNIGTLY